MRHEEGKEGVRSRERRDMTHERRETREVARDKRSGEKEDESGATRDDTRDERVEMRRGNEERDAPPFTRGLSLSRAKARTRA